MRSIMILLLIVSILNVGCASRATYATGQGPDGITTVSAGGAHLGVDAHGHYRQVHGGGDWPVWVAAGFLLATVVTIDLLILPFTTHDPFPCCRGVLELCH